MKIGKEDVAKIAELSRLKLSPDKVGEMARQFQEILNYFSQLQEVPTDDVEPTYRPRHQQSQSGPLRADEVARSLDQKEALSNAPETEDGLFCVPKVIE